MATHPPARPKQFVIALMGETGTGKSTFINLASGGTMKVGNGLESCTATVQTCSFSLHDHTVTLIDTPGFDDTNLSDSEVLKRIALHLEVAYKVEKTVLAGILFLHRIQDPRVGGVSRKNFGMFRKLCGDKTLKNVTIVTTMWAQVEPGIGTIRERQLQTEEKFFKPALDKGAKMVRHNNTAEKAKEIIWEIVKNNCPEALCIQKELVEQHLDITQTSAGQELDHNLAALTQKYEKELNDTRARLAEALKEKDEETSQELETEKKRMEIANEKIKQEREHLSKEYANERRELYRIIEGLRRDNEALRSQRTLPEDRKRSMKKVKTFMKESPLGYLAYGIVNAVKGIFSGIVTSAAAEGISGLVDPSWE